MRACTGTNVQTRIQGLELRPSRVRAAPFPAETSHWPLSWFPKGNFPFSWWILGCILCRFHRGKQLALFFRKADYLPMASWKMWRAWLKPDPSRFQAHTLKTGVHRPCYGKRPELHFGKQSYELLTWYVSWVSCVLPLSMALHPCYSCETFWKG